jgi:putative endonuclease
VRQGCTGASATSTSQCISMKFYYVYILHNASKNFIYAGYSEDLKTRHFAHNDGKVTSTKAYVPLELIHYEAYHNMKDAKRREEYFKTTKGRVTLKVMLKEYFVEKQKVQS